LLKEKTNLLKKEKIAAKIELNSMSIGGNVKLMLPYDEGVFL